MHIMADIHETRCLPPQWPLQGRYIIIETVGEGGMGTVYKAIDTQTNDCLVAIKEMCLDHYRSYSKQNAAQKLFRREARILSNLSHPNLPRVYAFFNENRRSYLVMDFIEGKTLAQLLKESTKAYLPVKDVLYYALQLCSVLSYLHQQTPPIIFRDLKPSNVMVTAKGHIYLIDFGIVRVFKANPSSDTQHFGTPGFASPEQYGNGQAGPRSDLYNLGATLHYCLTGKDPRLNQPTLFHFLPPHTLNSQVSASLSELIQHLVATREDQRPPDAETVQRELLSIYRPTSTTDVKTNSTYNDTIAHNARPNSWMRHHIRQLGLLCIWLTSTIAHQLANIYGLLCTWFLLTIQPRLKHLYHHHIRVSPTWATEFWQSFSTTKARLLIQDLWTPYFTFLFALFAIAMTGGSMYMLAILHYPVHLVAFYLYLPLPLLLSTAYTNQRIFHPLTRSIMMAMALFLLVTGIALFALPEVQSIIRTTTFNQLLTVSIIVLVTVSLLRPTQHFAWVDNLCLAVIAATYALLSSNMGAQALHQLLLIPMNNARLVNLALVATLCLVALRQLGRRKRPFTRSGRPWYHFLPFFPLFTQLGRRKRPFTRSGRPWYHRLPLFTVALIAAILQLAYGLQEITHLPPFMFHIQQTTELSLNLATFNVLLASVPVVTALLRLFVTQGSSHLRRLLLLLLGLSCAALQNFLGPVVQFPLLKTPQYPLGTTLASIMHINQLAAYSLALIAYVLVCRWQRPFGWFDHFSLLCVVTVCAFLQSTACNNSCVSHSPQGVPIQQSQLYMIAINKLLAQMLMLIVLAVLTITISRIFLHLASNFTWVDRQIMRANQRFMWLDHFPLPFNHFILLVTSITNILLLWLHSNSILRITTSILSFTFMRFQLIIASLLICSLATLIRISRPFNSNDRWFILINVVTCDLLLFTGYAQQTIMQDSSKITSVKPWLVDPHIVLPPQVIMFGLLFAVLVSFMWIKRRFPQTHRSMLKVGFGLTLACAVLQWLTPAFLLASLIMLTLSILLAIRMEQA